MVSHSAYFNPLRDKLILNYLFVPCITCIGGDKGLKQNFKFFSNKPPIYKVITVGMLTYIFILLTVLIAFYYYPSPLNVKISVAAIPIGLLIFFMITEKFFTKKVGDIEITLFIIAWTLLTFFITGPANLEIFVVLVILALLITKEIAYDFTPTRLKNKLNVLISILLIFFVLIMTDKIIDILNI